MEQQPAFWPPEFLLKHLFFMQLEDARTYASRPKEKTQTLEARQNNMGPWTDDYMKRHLWCAALVDLDVCKVTERHVDNTLHSHGVHVESVVNWMKKNELFIVEVSPIVNIIMLHTHISFFHSLP